MNEQEEYNKNMKKYALFLLAIVFVPSIAFASWWNPFTWFTKNTALSNHSSVQSEISIDKLGNINSPEKTIQTKILPKKTARKSTPTVITEQVVLPPPQQKDNVPTASAITTPPPNTTLCNGIYYNPCFAGQDFICPSNGNGYCQLSQQQQEQLQQAQLVAAQQKTNQINTLTSQYNTQFNALEQQIINIKNQYYKDLVPIDGSGTNLMEAQGEKQNLLNKDNALISQIQLQEQQLYLDYSTKINALR